MRKANSCFVLGIWRSNICKNCVSTSLEWKYVYVYVHAIDFIYAYLLRKTDWTAGDNMHHPHSVFLISTTFRNFLCVSTNIFTLCQSTNVRKMVLSSFTCLHKNLEKDGCSIKKQWFRKTAQWTLETKIAPSQSRILILRLHIVQQKLLQKFNCSHCSNEMKSYKRKRSLKVMYNATSRKRAKVSTPFTISLFMITSKDINRKHQCKIWLKQHAEFKYDIIQITSNLSHRTALILKNGENHAVFQLFGRRWQVDKSAVKFMKGTFRKRISFKILCFHNWPLWDF